MKKKKFKMPNAFIIIFLIIIIVAGLTWIVPSGEYKQICTNGNEALNIAANDEEASYVCPVNQGAAKEILYNKAGGNKISKDLYTTKNIKNVYKEKEKNQQGVWQILSSPVNGLSAALEIFVFILAIGGFIYIAMETKTIDAGTNLLVKKLKGKDKWLILILIATFSFLGTLEGFAEESIPLYLLIVPLFISLGYDAIVGVMILMVGGGVGVLASTVNPFATGIGSASAGVSLGQGIVGRFILWIIVTILAYIFTLRYANKVKKDPQKSLVYDLNQKIKEKLKIHDEAIKVEDLKKGQGLCLTLFGITFLLMIMCVIPWSNFGINIFDNFNSWLQTYIPFLTGHDGMPSLGNWGFYDLAVLFLVFGFIIGFIGKRNKLIKGDLVDLFIEGAKDLLSVALIIAVARGIQVVLATSGMDATLLYYGSNALNGLNKQMFSILTFILYIPLSFLIPSTSGMASASLPIIGPLATNVFQSINGASIAVTAFTAGSGVMNLITPTSGVVMGGLAIAGVPFDRWIKHLWKFMLLLVVVVVIFLYIITSLNFYI